MTAWTTEKPTQPGWYWWRVDAAHSARVHEFTMYEGRFLETNVTGRLFNSVVCQCGEWQGPIAPHE